MQETKKKRELTPKIKSALSILSIIRQETDSIGVAISYGKDSLVTLDLCSRVFKTLYGFYMYRVANLDIVDQWKQCVQSRYEIEIIDYPHFDLSRCYRNCVLTPHWRNTDDIPNIRFVDVEKKFRNDTGTDWIAYGWRRNDSFSRALIMKKCRGYDENSRRIFPIRSFTRTDVYSYLDSMNITRPTKLGREEQGGLDFHKGAIESLSDNDRKKWMNDFPFSGSVEIDNDSR